MSENIINSFNTPILLVIFNRPEVTRHTFEAIRLARPSKLFIATDGYRPDRAGEKELCERTKQIVANVDWPCEVYTDYLTTNIGPCKRLPSAIDWFFENVEQGIILEDDCLPNRSFFSFCQELLEKYKTEEKIMSISGSNFQEKRIGEASYYFSFYPVGWGWATWRRAWKLFDREMKQYPSFVKENKIKNIIPDKKNNEQGYWLNFLKKEYEGKYIYWDLKWAFSHWSNGAVSIVPNYNLITNVGFGQDATHSKEDVGLSIPAKEMDNVIIHPKEIIANREADKYLYNKVYKIAFWKKVIYKIKSILKI